MCFWTLNFIFVINCVILLSGGSDIFHQNSRTTFYPDVPSTYFGYSVVLSSYSFIVGAPKAVSRVNASIAPGQVFTCRLTNLDEKNVTCYPLGMDNTGHDKSIRRMVNVKDFFRNDMWYGAAVATIPDGKLIACAPRWADYFSKNHLLAHGACYLETKKQGITLTPLKERFRLAWLTDGARKEYGDYGTNLNFYAYGQAGMSVKVTNTNRIIIGAPGLMQWTGGIIDYSSVTYNKIPVANTYFTRELGPDNYFGYSVESGIFELNSTILYVAGAPRSKDGYGQVLLFEPPVREQSPLKIRVQVTGSQLGSYFGATLCCTDLNRDGRDDLLVGAPNFVTTDHDMPFDQGAVFVYLAGASGTEVATINLIEAEPVLGIKQSGARFGSAIAALGDIDGDGYNDVAIGAPWENDGLGAVYIYQGDKQGLKLQYLQRISAADARGFGMSISKGLDVDANNCSDLAVGAHNSATAYIYRCVPTIMVKAFIKVPDALSLPINVSSFQAEFCVQVAESSSWGHVKIDLKALLTIDPEYNRASAEQEEYKFTAEPGVLMCKEQTITVQPTANLSRPIMMKMDLEEMSPLFDNSSIFLNDAARLSENSILKSSFLIQLMRDCGDDLVCTPALLMTLDAIDKTYVPGSSTRLGIQITVLNKEEPAYDVQVYIILPLPPKRVPRMCILEDLIMLCDVRSPLNRGESEIWEVEVEYSLQAVKENIVTFHAQLEHPEYIRNVTGQFHKSVNVLVLLQARFEISGKSMPNNTITTTREKFNEAGDVSFVHYYEITNLGPSDRISLDAVLGFPENITISAVSGCNITSQRGCCRWSVPANTSIEVAISMKYNLSKYGSYFEELTIFNTTTSISLDSDYNEESSITTELILEPAKPIWPYIVAIVVSTIIGLLMLAGIVYGLHRIGFFSRTSRDELQKRRQEGANSAEVLITHSEPSCSNLVSEPDDSTQELLLEDSD